MIRKTRILLASIVFVLITGLFLDFTGTLHHWFSWLAKIQFLPAVLALNFVAIAFLLLITLLFGRIYCSVICPLGVMQDIVSNISARRKKHQRRFKFSPAKSLLRYSILGLFVLAMILGIGSIVALLAPYSSFGRIAQNLLSPIYLLGNNALAYIAERINSYTFYSRDIWIRSLPTFIVAAISFIIVIVLAWRNGRTYCNTICPVGTVLGFVSRFAWFKAKIDKSKCTKCGLCSKSCKASCIDFKNQKIDYSRCVVCGDCMSVCHKQAIDFVHIAKDNVKEDISTKVDEEKPSQCNVKEKSNEDETQSKVDASRRAFLVGAAIATTTAAIAQEKKKVDGGLAEIKDKVAPERITPLTPPGSLSAENMARHCTGCQLCVSACPNDVLRPSTGLTTMMQPVMSYERGYCRPECTRCSEVCPTQAITKIDKAQKSSIQIGHAVWVRKNCVPLTDGVECGNCARHCPVGAIMMVNSKPGDDSSPKIPAINTERCIGCGTCENLCPSRPFSAIYVEGHESHRFV